MDFEERNKIFFFYTCPVLYTIFWCDSKKIIYYYYFFLLQDGYFGLTTQNPGCTACNCDSAGSLNKSCSSTGQCYCRRRFSGDKCHVIESGFFVPSVDSMTFQAENALAVTVSVATAIFVLLILQLHKFDLQNNMEIIT